MNYKFDTFFLHFFTKKVLLIRNWESSTLPIEQSRLAMDLFLFIALQNIQGTPPNLKTVFNSVNFSEAGVRKHLHRLIKDGWCYLANSNQDKRVRLVFATEKMLSSMEDYVNIINSTCLEASKLASERNNYFD